MGHRYLEALMKFFGVEPFLGLFVEGHSAEPDKAEQIKADAIARAKELAQTF